MLQGAHPAIVQKVIDLLWEADCGRRANRFRVPPPLHKPVTKPRNCTRGNASSYVVLSGSPTRVLIPAVAPACSARGLYRRPASARFILCKMRYQLPAFYAARSASRVTRKAEPGRGIDLVANIDEHVENSRRRRSSEQTLPAGAGRGGAHQSSVIYFP